MLFSSIACMTSDFQSALFSLVENIRNLKINSTVRSLGTNITIGHMMEYHEDCVTVNRLCGTHAELWNSSSKSCLTSARPCFASVSPTSALCLLGTLKEPFVTMAQTMINGSKFFYLPFLPPSHAVFSVPFSAKNSSLQHPSFWHFWMI